MNNKNFCDTRVPAHGLCPELIPLPGCMDASTAFNLSPLQVTLIDQGERFIFKPLLYELINGTAQSWEVAPTFAQLLAPYPIQFVQVRSMPCKWCIWLLV
jgi:hypothetical protein